jgi:hypothetical protein
VGRFVRVVVRFGVLRLGVPYRPVEDLGVSLTGDLEADLESEVVVKRAGVRFFIVYTELRQKVKNHVGFDLQLASQLIDSNLAHR